MRQRPTNFTGDLMQDTLHQRYMYDVYTNTRNACCTHGVFLIIYLKLLHCNRSIFVLHYWK